MASLSGRPLGASVWPFFLDFLPRWAWASVAKVAVIRPMQSRAMVEMENFLIGVSSEDQVEPEDRGTCRCFYLKPRSDLICS